MTLRYPVSPMKASLGNLPPDDENWAYEIKWDGYRTLVLRRRRRCSLAEQQPARRHGEVSGACTSSPGRSMPRSAIIDGELVVLDPDGRPSFELMQQHATQVAFYVFDVLSVDGHDTIALPYEQRRELVTGLVEAGSELDGARPPHRRRCGPG